MYANFNVVQILDKQLMYQGLSSNSIAFLRKSALWTPIVHNTIAINDANTTDMYQMYIENTQLGLITLIVEYGEFMSGVVYDILDYTETQDLNLFLHQYSLEDGSQVKEGIQAIEDDILFLNLISEQDGVLSEWSEDDIQETLMQNM